MKAFVIISMWAIAFAPVACNNTPDEEPLPTGESISSVPSVTSISYDQSAITGHGKTSAATGSTTVTPPSPTPPATPTPPAPPTPSSPTPPPPPPPATPEETTPATPEETTPATPEETTPATPEETTPAAPEETPAEPDATEPETTPETPTETTSESTPDAASGASIADVKKIVESMIAAANSLDAEKFISCLAEDQAEQFNEFVEAGNTLKNTFEETEKLVNEKLGGGIPKDIADSINIAMKMESTLFIQTLKGQNADAFTFKESDGKVTVEVGRQSKQLFLTFSKVDDDWKAEMDARWAGNMKTSKEQAEKYTNLLNDIQMMLNDGSMTKDNASKTYDDLKQKYNITTAPPTKPGP